MHDNTLSELLPGLSEDEHAAAIDNLQSYLMVIIRIYERTGQNPDALAELRRDLSEYAGESNAAALTETP